MEELEDQKGRKNINLTDQDLTDQDARFMKMRQGFLPDYNAQATVSPVKTGQETSGMLVTAVELVNEPADYARLIPMLQEDAPRGGGDDRGQDAIDTVRCRLSLGSGTGRMR